MKGALSHFFLNTSYYVLGKGQSFGNLSRFDNCKASIQNLRHGSLQMAAMC